MKVIMKVIANVVAFILTLIVAPLWAATVIFLKAKNWVVTGRFR